MAAYTVTPKAIEAGKATSIAASPPQKSPGTCLRPPSRLNPDLRALALVVCVMIAVSPSLPTIVVSFSGPFFLVRRP